MKTKIIFVSILAALVAVVFLVPKKQNSAAFGNSEICSFAAENGLNPSDYPNELVAMLERNPETREFVLNYPLKKDAKFDCTVTLPEDGSVPLFFAVGRALGVSGVFGGAAGIERMRTNNSFDGSRVSSQGRNAFACLHSQIQR